MKDLEHANPICTFLFFFEIISLTALLPHPIFTAISLLGAVVLCLIYRQCTLKRVLCYTALFVITAFINPVFNHNGRTVLFFVNDNPITLESVLYGLNSAGMILAVLLWFGCFSYIMTTDKLLYVFSLLSKKAALILSVALRYVPLFFKKRREISESAKGMGVFKDDNLPDRIKGHLKVFSALVTFGLEKGIITADSMEARGYGVGRRSRFSPFKFSFFDGLFAAFCLCLTVSVLLGHMIANIDFRFYPSVYWHFEQKTAPIFILFFMLSFLPCFISAKEELKWQRLRQKI